MKSIEIVGSSTEIRGRALGASRVQMVSPISTSSMPARMIMSPGCGRFHFFQVDPVVDLEFGDPQRHGLSLPRLCRPGLSLHEPCRERPCPRPGGRGNRSSPGRPPASGTARQDHRRAAGSRPGWPGRGASGPAPVSSRVFWAIPSRPMAYRTGKSICSSVASRSMKRS